MCLYIVLAIALLTTTVGAVDHPISGHALLLKDSATEPTRRAFNFKTTHDPGVNPAQANDPRRARATVEVLGEGAGDGSSGVVPLDADSWTALGSPAGSKGYKWSHRGPELGIRKVYFLAGSSGGTIRIAAGGPAWEYRIAAPQRGPVVVRLTIAADVWCARFDPSFVVNVVGELKAWHGVVGDSCDVCGDGIRGATEQCDDGNTVDGDGCSSSCTIEPAPCPGGLCMPVVVSAEPAGSLPMGPGVLAKDLAINASTGTKIRYFFGDTLGDFNADGTIATNSAAEAPVATPLEATNLSDEQVVPFTDEEAQWNLDGPTMHAYRWGLPPAGAVSEGSTDIRLFYEVDEPVYQSSVEGAFYELFPVARLGTAVVSDDESAAIRDTSSEIALQPDEWPTGFHRLSDGTVRFFVAETSDVDPTFPMRRGTWTTAAGFQIDAMPLFAVDAVAGWSVFWNAYMNQWLATWVDHTGAIRLSTLAEDGTLASGTPAFVYQILDWNGPWDGYLAVHIDGADTDGGNTFLLVYSRMTGTFSTELPVIRVTIAGSS